MSDLETLDARGLLCPLPVIRTQDKVKGLTPGTVLEVLATDAGAVQDIPAWCRVHGHELISIEQDAAAATADGGDQRARFGGGHEIRIRLKVCC